MAKKQDDTNKNLTHLILDGMSPNVKAVFFGLLGLPLFVALSAMILGFNAGSWMDKYFNHLLNVEQKMLMLEEQELAELKKHTSVLLDLQSIEPRVEHLEIDVEGLKKYACGHEGKQFCGVPAGE